MKYADILKLGKDALDAIKAPFKVRKAKADLEAKVIVVEQEIAEAELEVQSAKGTDPIDLETIIDKSDTLDLKKRKLGQLKALQEELF